MTTAESGAAQLSALAAKRYVGLRPGRGFLVLPATPRRALWAGLGLYDGVEPLQRGLLRAAQALVATRLERLLPSNSPQGLDWEWWGGWFNDIAVPLVGPVGHIAIRMPPNGRTCMLLMDAEGTPTGFIKLLAQPLSEFSVTVRQYLARQQLQSVHIPRTLAEGNYRGRDFIMFQPITAGPHRRPPFDPGRVATIVDEWRSFVSDIPRPPGVPEDHFVCHTGFTPRNVRVAGADEWWLYDWDNVTWGPRMVPELRYWAADFTYQWRVDPTRAARKIYGLLRQRATDAEIAAAAGWTGSLPTYRPTEKLLHDAVGILANEAART